MNESETLQERAVGVRMQILIGEAIEWLRERNKILNVNFTYEDALRTANQLAFLEKVNEVKEDMEKFVEMEIADGFTMFRGDNNCKISCRGWDGESDRCECGERRVGWDYDYKDDYFKNPTCFGMAE
ncbi:hypothetical protein KAU33_04130 [Candidatus Dependentiae bacterium]|nr:hypothetical protein [Candidatus Dependentiae bacterium]